MSGVTRPQAHARAANEFLAPARPRNFRTRSSFRAPLPAYAPEPGSANKRRLLGLGLLAVVVIGWTTSGFLQSSIFADNTYSKPFFLTYINTAFFTLPLAPFLIARGIPPRTKRWFGLSSQLDYKSLQTDDDDDGDARTCRYPPIPTFREPLTSPSNTPHNYDTLTNSILKHHTTPTTSRQPTTTPPHTTKPPLTLRETASLSLRFCLLWYMANYANASSLHFTSVASFTIISTTSSIFTLLFGSLLGVETFSARKLLGVLACLAGVIVTSTVEASGSGAGGEGHFPVKTTREVLIGDGLALTSAVLYGLYCVLLARQVPDESRISMPIFFGFLGLFNILLLWPGLLLLNYTGIEHFHLPQTSRIWGIIIVNATSGLVSDLCWAYAVLFTSPLVVTVGLSLCIPLALVGQVVLQGVVVGWVYWLGAGVVVGSFVFVNNESGGEEGGKREGNGVREDEDDEREET